MKILSDEEIKQLPYYDTTHKWQNTLVESMRAYYCEEAAINLLKHVAKAQAELTAREIFETLEGMAFEDFATGNKLILVSHFDHITKTFYQALKSSYLEDK